MNTIQVPVLIIGAGPAGLATAAQLQKRNISYEIIEGSGQVANAWRAHYDRLCLHTVKEKSHLPGLPFPDNYPRYVTRHELVDYFDHYQSHFNIRPKFNTAATSIYKKGDNWVVDTNADITYTTPQLIVASGVNHSAYWPIFPGESEFKGLISHSKTYKNAKPYIGMDTLIIGMGNTGAEIALDLAESGAKSTTIAVRGAVNIVPRELRGRPTQLTALALSKLPNWLGDWIGVQVRRLTMGDLAKYNLPFPKIPPAKQLRTTGKTPVVDLGTADYIRAGKIKIINSGIKQFHANTVAFENGNQKAFDAVILATGYKANLKDMIQVDQNLFDQYGWPEFVIGKGSFSGLNFIGYDNYTPGGILGVINRDCVLIANEITRTQGSLSS